jgi:hypothetical protein
MIGMRFYVSRKMSALARNEYHAGKFGGLGKERNVLIILNIEYFLFRNRITHGFGRYTHASDAG